MQTSTKHCPKCNTTKPVDGFARNRSTKDGRSCWCKACMKAAIQKWNAANPEKMKAAGTRWRGRNRAERAAATRKYLAANPHIRSAHNAVLQAVRRGKLVKQPCEVCGLRADAHHDDYAKPLDVRWLCPSHHQLHHVEERSR
jgi:hypothetical protein